MKTHSSTQLGLVGLGRMGANRVEGLGILRDANVGKKPPHEIDAETTPLRDPEHYQYDLNLADVAEVNLWVEGIPSSPSSAVRLIACPLLLDRLVSPFPLLPPVAPKV